MHQIAFPLPFVYDAEAEKAKSVALLRRVLERWPEADARFLMRYFNSLQLAEIIVAFCDSIQNRMPEAELLQSPIGPFSKLDALDLPRIFREKELAEAVFQIVKTFQKNAAQNETEPKNRRCPMNSNTKASPFFRCSPSFVILSGASTTLKKYANSPDLIVF